VLQIGAHTYTNVTVTTKAEDYIFILHSSGMVNIKVVDLPPELQESLGYKERAAAAAAAKVKTNTSPVALAQKTLAKVQTPQVKAAEDRMRTLLEEQSARLRAYDVQKLKRMLALMGGVALVLFPLLVLLLQADLRKIRHRTRPHGLGAVLPDLSALAGGGHVELVGAWFHAARPEHSRLRDLGGENRPRSRV